MTDGGAPTTNGKPWMRAGVRWLGVVGVALVVLSVRVVVGAHRELAQAQAQEAAGDQDAAIVHYRRAARWYAPGNPYVTDALAALARLGRAAERDGDGERALFAWRSVRGAILATRSFYVPHADRLEEADEHIAELMASMEPPPVDAGKDRAELKAEHLALLADVGRPQIGWTLLLLVGFFGWVAGAFVFASRAFDEEDRLVRREAVRWGAVIVVGIALWLVGMALA